MKAYYRVHGADHREQARSVTLKVRDVFVERTRRLLHASGYRRVTTTPSTPPPPPENRPT